MNRKQKMISKMWKNYMHNCRITGEKPLYNYRVFRKVYSVESFNYIHKMKEWYKEVKI